MVKFILILFAVLGTIAVVAIVGWSSKKIYLGIQSSQWPVAQGTILSSSVKLHSSGQRMQGQARSHTYYADIKYQYTVNGVQYQSDQVSHGSISSSNPSRAQKVVVRYPQGKEVKVFYDPKNPREAVLETGLTFGAFLPLLILGVIVAFPIGIRFIFKGRQRTVDLSA